MFSFRGYCCCFFSSIGVDLCITYSVDPREFVEIFVAFCINHLNGADPTDSTLDDFERKELANHKAKNNKTTTSARIQQTNYEIDSDEEDDDVMGAYICTTPKVRNDFFAGFSFSFSSSSSEFLILKCNWNYRHKNRIDHVELVHLSVI